MSEKQITRRDLLNGMAIAGTALLAPSCKPGGLIGSDTSGTSAANKASDPETYYPPALTGLRGSHPGAFEDAHALAGVVGEKKNWGDKITDTNKYDLVIVGAGISGLSAAHFYRQKNPKARILILDNHDDFGGHAKRNEFTLNKQTYISYGGTQSIDNPSHYSKVAKDLLVDIGIDVKLFNKAYDKTYFSKHKMGQGIFFDKKTFGKNAMLQSQPPRHRGKHSTIAPGLKSTPEIVDVLNKAPLSPAQQTMISTLLTPSKAAFDYFSEANGGFGKLYKNNYVEFLRDVYRLTDPVLLTLLTMPLSDDYACGGTSVVLWDAVDGGLYGLPPKDFFKSEFAEETEADEYIYHFPDGNATIARLLVHELVPGVASFKTPQECLTSKFKYSMLDLEENPVRIRLSSLVVLADNVTDGQKKVTGTIVQYVKGGKLYECQATHTIMAGWHMMAAHIIPSLPDDQKKAMRANIKMPLVYAEVALKQWLPIQRCGIGTAYCPGSYFQFQYSDYPIKIGSFQPDREPSSPTSIIMIRMPIPPEAEGTPAELFRYGRWDLLGTTFATFETNIRTQLIDMYGEFGFDPSRDISAITVNRWSHGYIYWHNEFNGKPAHETARQTHGNIAIANADAAGDAYTNAAIDMAWRAVGELGKIS